MGADLAEEKPLAIKAAMVRQLASSRFSTLVDQSLIARAYVIGNPSTEGSAKAFQGPDDKEQPDREPLPGAEKEAMIVADVLARYGFGVECAIGADQRALDVIGRLCKHPYRIVHIAAHGVYDERAADGRARTGVLLSDGLLITAAEFHVMKTVPELVFFDCCHLGQLDRTPSAFNKLAYSVSRELIEIGVRAVVAAGWAVDDASASFFAETFYEALLRDNETFGEAVFRARQATWERFPSNVTFGAFQAYGDPGRRINLTADQKQPQVAS